MSRLLLVTGFVALTSASFVQTAAAADIGGTSWNLRGRVTGKAGVVCRVGGRAVGAAVPARRQFQNHDVNGNGKLDAKLSFSPGSPQQDGSVTGTFLWSDDELSPTSGFTSLQGGWTQKKNRIDLKFDNWAASPISVGAVAMAQALPALSGNTYSQGAAILSIEDTDDFDDRVTYQFSGRLNRKGTSLAITETFGFAIRATGSAYGASNTCTFKISGLGRRYTAVAADTP